MRRRAANQPTPDRTAELAAILAAALLPLLLSGSSGPPAESPNSQLDPRRDRPLSVSRATRVLAMRAAGGDA